MRTVRYTSRFRRDYKREKSGRHGKRLDAELLETSVMLAKDGSLPRRYFDPRSAASGATTAIAIFDLILIYRKPHEASLELVRLGSHSSLAYDNPSDPATLRFSLSARPIINLIVSTRRRLSPSFPRKRESRAGETSTVAPCSSQGRLWTPAFASLLRE